MTGILSIHYTMHAFLMVLFIDFPILQIRTTDAFPPRIHFLLPQSIGVLCNHTPKYWSSTDNNTLTIAPYLQSLSRSFFNSGAYFSPDISNLNLKTTIVGLIDSAHDQPCDSLTGHQNPVVHMRNVNPAWHEDHGTNHSKKTKKFYLSWMWW